MLLFYILICENANAVKLTQSRDTMRGGWLSGLLVDSNRMARWKDEEGKEVRSCLGIRISLWYAIITRSRVE